MKIQQQALQFRPITIHLETHEDVTAFYGLILKLQRTFFKGDFTDKQNDLIVQIEKSFYEVVDI